MRETHGDLPIDDRQPTDVKRPFEHPLRDKTECQKLAGPRIFCSRTCSSREPDK